MAGYSTSTPPSLLIQSISGAGPSVWFYKSADAGTVVRVTGYITNGGQLGMKVGDALWHHDSTLGLINLYMVDTVSATAPGAVDLTDATIIGSTTNTD